MSINDQTSSSTALTSALGKWVRERAADETRLEEIRLDEHEQFVGIFTDRIREVTVHFLRYPALKGFAHCNGTDCLLCQIGRHPEQRDLLPVYDPVRRSVVVLSVPATCRPQGLKAQLTPLLVKAHRGTVVLASVRKTGWDTFEVRELPAVEGADDGAEQITSFDEGFRQGVVDLARIYALVDNAVLAAVPEIAAVMKLKGLSA